MNVWTLVIEPDPQGNGVLAMDAEGTVTWFANPETVMVWAQGFSAAMVARGEGPTAVQMDWRNFGPDFVPPKFQES